MKLVTILALAGILALSTTPVLALDLNQPLKTLSGSDFTDQNGKAVDLTLDSAIESALLSAPAQTKEAKDRNYWLALEVHGHRKDFTPTPAQIVQIQEALSQTQTTAVYGQAMSLLDPTFTKAGK